MSDLLVRGVRLHVEDTGPEHTSARPIVFSHGLLWSCRLYDAQVAHLRRRHRCVAYDHRGQGQSEVPAGDEVSIETVYEDAVALLETLDLGPCHFVGLSMGGFVGLRIAARRPDLLRSLVLIDTAADGEPKKNIPKYRALNLVARYIGIDVVASRVVPIMFGKSFLRAHGPEATAAIGMNQPSIYKAVNGVIRRHPVVDEVPKIDVPTSILHGEEDVAISMARAKALHALLPRATFTSIPAAGHSAAMENPDAVNRALDAHLARVQ